MADELDEIRRRISIVDLVGQVVKLKRSGKNWTGLCPFHGDKNPSFNVSETSGHYRCWACGEKGDVFTWIMKTRNLPFVEALQLLAEQAGVTLKSRRTEDKEVKKSRQAAMDFALDFFKKELLRSSDARAYCEKRGLEEDILMRWEVGYAPDVGEALATQLRKADFKLDECKELFLVDQDPSGGYYDRFRGRLMFAIRDERNDLVAFGGRLLGDGHPKYINSGDTPIFRKSRVLYGLNVASNNMRKGEAAVLCEGYLDVIACHRSGVQTAVASLGTSLTDQHAKLLHRYTESVTILYDSDPAGEKAAQRASEIFQAEKMSVRVALMPKGEDPDTLLRQAGAAAVKLATEKGISPIDYMLLQIGQRLTPEDDAYWDEVIDALTLAKNDMELRSFAQRLSPLVPELRDRKAAAEWLRKQAVGRMRRKKDDAHDEPSGPKLASGKPKLGLKRVEADMFRAFLDETTRNIVYGSVTNADLFLTGSAISLANNLADAFPLEQPKGVLADWLSQVESEDARNLLVDLELTSNDPMTRPYVEDAIALLERERDKREQERVKHEVEGDERLKRIQEHLKKRDASDETM